MKLKYLTYFLLGIALFSIFWPGKMDLGLAAPAEDSAHDQIVAILTEQQAAWNRGDLDSFMKSYWNSPELTFAGSSGITRGWQSVLARYQSNYSDRQAMGHLDFSELEVHALGKDAAFVLGRWQERSLSVNIRWFILMVLPGNIAMLLYALIRLFSLKSKQTVTAPSRQKAA